MKKIGIAALALSVFWACSKPASENIVLKDRYIGYFNRTGMDTVWVSLLFTGNRFEGNSERAKYPAICGGSFSLQGNKIIFTDTCAWTADFDWSLVLNGVYTIEALPEQKFRIWRSNGNIVDEYWLSRPIR